MTERTANRTDHTRRRGAAIVAASLIACVLLVAQEPQAPPVFRAGTNIVRVDATVVDRSGNPVPSLTADDFEIREDGVPQPISSFKFILADGKTTDDRSLPIRSQEHAASEAERDDVRTFLILWDEYHIGELASAYRAREALERAVLTDFCETDLVALMDQLTPISAIEFTRDRRGMADSIRKLKGRRGVYLTRSPLEEQQMSAAMSAVGGIEGLRSMVSFDAIKAAATHLRTFGEGRKTLIVITEAFTPISQGRSIGGRSGDRGDSTDPALDLVRTANDSNVAIHVVDPAGLQMGSRPNFFFQTITADTGGELYRTNDLKIPFAKAVMGASAVYLLGYTRDMPGDGRFHQLKVNVKRRGLDVRARAGFWAPSTGEVERARAAAESAALPTPVADAFSSLTPGASPRQVDIFAGIKPLADGRMQVSLAWTRRSSDPRNTPSRVTVTAKAKAVVFDGEVRPDGTTFDTEAANLQLAFTVLSENGDVLDRETRTIDPSPMSAPRTTPALSVCYLTKVANQPLMLCHVSVPRATLRTIGDSLNISTRPSTYTG
jgi:VWFA-related protein